MRRRLIIVLCLAVVLVVAARLVMVTRDLPAQLTGAHFEGLRPEPNRLRAFLHRMPKGGDLHTHLSGAVYAERLIAWAIADGLCLDPAAMVILSPPANAPAERPCGDEAKVVPIADAVAGWRGQTTYDLLVDALSMRWFLPTPAVPSGHDQFFSTFSKFNPATGGSDWQRTLARTAEMTVDQLRQYQAENVQYAEFMVTLLEGEDRRRLGEAIGSEREPKAMLAALEQSGITAVVTQKVEELRALVARVDEMRGCAADRTRPGCGVQFRYIAQVNRNGAPAEVFAQTAVAAALARAAPSIVAGLNYVGPEDYRAARQDYRTHMRWIGFLAADVPVALHAGELWLGLVPPPDLDFHIRDAIETASARRIGHGTAIGFERDMDGLLAEMKRRGVAVEIALTSSDVILGVRGRNHPIRTYLSAGVDVTLATDDAGVSRIDLTNEYVRAARDHGLGYGRLKRFAFAALEKSFLPAADKQQQEQKLQRAFAAFEQEVTDDLAWPDWLAAFARALLPRRG
ncbi:adenosine deaminase [Xanthobacter sp. KR7-65]|uniref:adenosine deaminase n=1 Tax=Xanthobacter sp. KR7-65 TaxID=3156612 RepID=UPI0032B58EF2